jgi:cyclopropane-fatty-acyl-phospholipid synthase
MRLSPVELCERGLVPDWLARQGMRRMMAQRLRDEAHGGVEAAHLRQRARIQSWRTGPMAIETATANAQHYELPPAFFQRVLGPHLKYSACYFPPGTRDLGEAEAAALRLVCDRAGLEDGMSVLELGCGWGSLTLWMAQHFPGIDITAVSNSHAQRRFIEELAQARGLANVRVLTADINQFSPEHTFDRVVSVEMFEHVRNHEALFARIRSWLRPDGRLFCHVFAHREYAYPFEVTGEGDWMARLFFTGGLMPSEPLFLNYQRDLVLEAQWRLSGVHYQRTAEAWLANLDRDRAAVSALFREVYGPEDAARWLQRWRMFFMACAELFGYAGGSEWLVVHYLFSRRG